MSFPVRSAMQHELELLRQNTLSLTLFHERNRSRNVTAKVIVA